MTECIHGLEEDFCGVCGRSAQGSSVQTGTMAGKSFALVYAPSLRDDTFLHLNREGDHWKFRWYSSPHREAIVEAQSGKSFTRRVLELNSVELVHEISYPYTTSPGGVSVTDYRYWFNEIAKANTELLANMRADDA